MSITTNISEVVINYMSWTGEKSITGLETWPDVLLFLKISTLESVIDPNITDHQDSSIFCANKQSIILYVYENLEEFRCNVKELIEKLFDNRSK